MRLEPQPGERIDRGRSLSFRFEAASLEGFEGDTIGSALFAAGRRVFSRSFKYHRPRGLLCCTGNCPNCLMEVDGVPNVEVITRPGETGTARFVLDRPGEYRVLCSVEGHEEAGMVGTLVVVAP